MRLPVAVTMAFLTIAPAQAVIILDSTWAEEGGAVGSEAAGFGAAIELANQPQFDALISFSTDGETWGTCSGTWIGNDGDTAYVLTAGHCFQEGETAAKYSYRTQGGTVLEGADLFVHPGWTGNLAWRTGYDIDIVTLVGAVTDGGEQPAIYAGTGEKDRILTFVGFGSRGIGSAGQDAIYYGAENQHDEKAAAVGRIERVEEAVQPLPEAADETDAGNYLGVVLYAEDGSTESPYGGESIPVSRLAGLLGSGDSGGSAWIETADGTWAIAGVNSNGTGKAAYGDKSWFVRVSAHREWIASVFPGAIFIED